MPRKAATSQPVGDNVATPRRVITSGIYTGDDIRRIAVRPGSQDAFKLPSLVAGKPVSPAQLHEELRAPVVAPPPVVSRTTSRIADPAAAPLPDPPPAPLPAPEAEQPAPAVTYIQTSGHKDAIQSKPGQRFHVREVETELAQAVRDASKTLTLAAGLLDQAAAALLSLLSPTTTRSNDVC